jgi:hypothetical protein
MGLTRFGFSKPKIQKINKLKPDKKINPSNITLKGL